VTHHPQPDPYFAVLSGPAREQPGNADWEIVDMADTRTHAMALAAQYHEPDFPNVHVMTCLNPRQVELLRRVWSASLYDVQHLLSTELGASAEQVGELATILGVEQ
jgi:hypothetical protein